MSNLHHLGRSIVAAALLPIALAGCGGESGDQKESTPAAAQSDTLGTRYVDSVCSAAARMFTAYQKSFQENREALGGMDPTDAYARTAKQPFAVLVDELEKLTPPGEAANDHADTIRHAKEVLDALNHGDRQKLLALRGTPDTGTWKQVIELAAPLKTRFGPASQQIDSCQQLAKNGGGNPFQ